jgi:hypothetical protein
VDWAARSAARSAAASSLSDVEEMDAESAAEVGGVLLDDCAFEELASAVRVLRRESGVSERVRFCLVERRVAMLNIVDSMRVCSRVVELLLSDCYAEAARGKVIGEVGLFAALGLR